MKRIHFTDNYIINPVHPISVLVIGCGGTGSQVLTNLARINHALINLNHPGLNVTASDDDVVTEFNCGRQLFSYSDIGLNKADVLITRLNRFFGTSWSSLQERFNGIYKLNYNIVITCVDNLETRKLVSKSFQSGRDDNDSIYWMDFGNGKDFGQVVIGTVRKVEQPKKSKHEVIPVLKKFTDFRKIHELGKKFSIINSSEMDAIESIFTTSADKHIFRTQLAQLGNYYTDMASRLVTMTAFMLKDGSYDAHTYNPDTNKLSYDVTKDKRFYKDDKWISDNAELIFKDLVRSQINVGLATSENDMTVGYDFVDANTRFKWYSDKYIIGSMDEYQKVLLGNTAVGQLFTQFRNYLPDKAFNILGTNRQTSYGAIREVNMNADNEMEVIRKQIEIEGTAASLWYLLEDVVKVVRTKDMSFKDIELSAMRKYNIGLVVGKAVMLTTILVALKMMCDAGMSDRDKDKLEWLYGELMAMKMYEMQQNREAAKQAKSDALNAALAQNAQSSEDKRLSREQTARIAEANRLQQLQIAQGNQGMRNEVQQLKLQQLQDKSDAVALGKQQKIDKGTETVRQTLEQMNEVYAHPGLKSGTGFTTALSYIPTTDAKDFKGQLETLQAKTFLSGVESMKGLGALTETEGAKVTKAIGSLDPAVGEVAFRKNMQKIARDVVSMAKANGYIVPMPEWAKPAESVTKQAGGASADFSHPDDIQAILNKQR